ncbi:hypothetical protein Q1695_009652 [Nippostrongylus brasiliensis]|nr:hypothetical protein Q1695_009652 [Nippostrongylus brasiliensis]
METFRDKKDFEDWKSELEHKAVASRAGRFPSYWPTSTKKVVPYCTAHIKVRETDVRSIAKRQNLVLARRRSADNACVPDNSEMMLHKFNEIRTYLCGIQANLYSMVKHPSDEIEKRSVLDAGQRPKTAKELDLTECGTDDLQCCVVCYRRFPNTIDDVDDCCSLFAVVLANSVLLQFSVEAAFSSYVRIIMIGVHIDQSYGWPL